MGIIGDGSDQRVDSQGWRPRNVVWELTLGCNLRCRHCGSSAGIPRPGELTTAQCLSVAQQLGEMGCELVTLSGGEPTLRPDWDVVARALVDAGMHVNLVTNGVYPDDAHRHDVLKRAQRAGLSNVGISVDGPQNVHESIRGRGTFDNVMASVAALVAGGLKVSVLTTISQLNAHCLQDVLDMVEHCGAEQWRLQLAKPMGNLEAHKDWMVEPARLLQLIPWLAQRKRTSRVHIAVGDSLGYYGPHDDVLRGTGWRGRNERWHGCQAGMQALGIESDGGVKGCLSLQARPDGVDLFREGDLRTQSLKAIWYAPGAFAYNRDFVPSQLEGFCSSCRKSLQCRGGAKCVAAAVTGGVAQDPYCYHRVQALHAARTEKLAGTSVAAAAAALVLSLGSPSCKPSSGNEDAGGSMADASSRPDAAMSWDASAPDADPCANACCECDYGTPPPAQCCAVTDAGPVVDAAVPDADVCASVCCECDYGVSPPPECCQPQDAGASKDGSISDAAVTDADPCANACCDCDYGIPPPECCARG